MPQQIMLLPRRMVAVPLQHVFRHLPRALIIAVGQGVIAHMPQFDPERLWKREVFRVFVMIALRLAQQQIRVIIFAVLHRRVEFVLKSLQSVQRFGDKGVFQQFRHVRLIGDIRMLKLLAQIPLIIRDQLPRQIPAHFPRIVMRVPPMLDDQTPHLVVQQDALAGFVLDERQRLQLVQQDAAALVERQVGNGVKNLRRHAAVREGQIGDGVIFGGIQGGDALNQDALEQVFLARRDGCANCAGSARDFIHKLLRRQRAAGVIHPIGEQREQHRTAVREQMKRAQQFRRADPLIQRGVGFDRETVLPESNGVRKAEMREIEFNHAEAGAIKLLHGVAAGNNQARVVAQARKQVGFEPVGKTSDFDFGVTAQRVDILNHFVGVEKERDDFAAPRHFFGKRLIIAAKHLLHLRQQFFALARVGGILILPDAARKIGEMAQAEIDGDLRHDAHARAAFGVIKVNQFPRERHLFRPRRANLLHSPQQLGFSDAAVALRMDAQDGHSGSGRQQGFELFQFALPPDKQF